MHVVSRGLVFDANQQPPEAKVNAFTDVARLSNGDWLCSFQSGPTKHHRTSTVRVCRSKDGGATWREVPFRFPTSFKGVPGSLSSLGILEVSPGKLLGVTTWFDRSDPDRPLFDPITEGVLHGKQLKAFSSNGGETWSGWEQIDVGALTGVAACGNLVLWPDGTVAYPFESYKDFDDPTPGRHAGWMVLSTDGGKTFGKAELVAQHPQHKEFYWDQRMCPTPDGKGYVSMFWTHDLTDKRDLTVHLRKAQRGDGNNFSRSPITDTGIDGQISAPLFLPDGRLVSFIVDRNISRTMKLWVSADEGRTWPKDKALTVYTHDEKALLMTGATQVDFKQYWEDMGKWTFGHPAARQLDKDHVLLVHYAGAPGALSVHWEKVCTRD